MISITYDGETKLPARLLSLLSKEKKETLKKQYMPELMTDTIKLAMVKDLEAQLMPSDDMSHGWEYREAARHGAIRALKKAIDYLP